MWAQVHPGYLQKWDSDATSNVWIFPLHTSNQFSDTSWVGVLQFNSILTPSPWRQIPQVEGSVLQDGCPALGSAGPQP